jgi:hypothetical protein
MNLLCVNIKKMSREKQKICFDKIIKQKEKEMAQSNVLKPKQKDIRVYLDK